MEPAHEAPTTASRLTPREWDVLRLVLAGQTDKQIALALGISPRTASNHVASILHKLHVETRKGAQRWATSHGLTVLPPAAQTTLATDPGSAPV